LSGAPADDSRDPVACRDGATGIRLIDGLERGGERIELIEPLRVLLRGCHELRRGPDLGIAQLALLRAEYALVAL
jgi:hypothetical protein